MSKPRDDEVHRRTHDLLEHFWGTAWGEAEAAARDQIESLIRDPEQTQRPRKRDRDPETQAAPHSEQPTVAPDERGEG